MFNNIKFLEFGKEYELNVIIELFLRYSFLRLVKLVKMLFGKFFILFFVKFNFFKFWNG